MARLKEHGNDVTTVGELPSVGTKAPDFTLVDLDLRQKSLQNYAGKQIILNIFPSVDTKTCATSVRRFNERAAGLQETVVLCISKDLPFAQKRFCGSEGIDSVEPLSAFKSSFGEDYGITLAEGPLTGFFARAIVVISAAGEIVYTELVQEVADEPDYEAAFAALRG
ncbi:thiol peroxidase [Canibacter sp. lx-72]|uniref:thiol peroxidase n=1 Tax=Canibacter zhuwentaonis TaxID=2837491 RepID=UPI001BDD8DAE|nr:thiol peroxidase [Canibacter zhuwentaonis]MBT1018153.1 thiol peroxidase [Canibacter zhuwentaonis]MBT1035164.1 thiol peroxidase [Canibacter zhuwentaonis]